MTTRVEILERRARRLRFDGAYRKSANAYGELTSIEPERGRWWVLLGVMLHRAGRRPEAHKALRQAMYLFRREARTGCMHAVEHVLCVLDAAHTAAA